MAAALLSMRAVARFAGTSQRWYSAAVKTANLDTRPLISNETRKNDLLDIVLLKQESNVSDSQWFSVSAGKNTVPNYVVVPLN